MRINLQKLRKKGSCQDCRGTGNCPQCFASGVNLSLSASNPNCPACGGRGGCRTCEGTGTDPDDLNRGVTVLRLLVSSIPLEQLYKLVVDAGASNYSGWLIFVCFWCPVLFFVWKDEDFSSISFRRQRPVSLFGPDTPSPPHGEK